MGKLPEPRVAQMCDLIEPQPAEKIGKMKKLRRTLSDSFSRIGKWRAVPGTRPGALGPALLALAAQGPPGTGVGCAAREGWGNSARDLGEGDDKKKGHLFPS